MAKSAVKMMNHFMRMGFFKESRSSPRRGIEEKKESILLVPGKSLVPSREEGFLFVNNLGLPLTFYVQTRRGEKQPPTGTITYSLASNEEKFILQNELLSRRTQQLESLISSGIAIPSATDILRIKIVISQWGHSPDIPIELSQNHSFVMKEGIKGSKDRFLHAINCRITSIGLSKKVVFESCIILANNSKFMLEFYLAEKAKACKDTI